MEPGTPTPVLKVGEREYPLAWNQRSKAILSKHGYGGGKLLQALRKKETALYALCVATAAALPPEHTPEDPADLAEWFRDGAVQDAASDALVKLWRFHLPPPAEKKSASKR